jgi:hypothetical protein
MTTAAGSSSASRNVVGGDPLGKLVRWGRGPVGGILSSGVQGTKLMLNA